MRLRHPPGRAGRLWLEHRVEVASRGADLLDKKRRALVQEHRQLRVLARETEAEWTRMAREAEAWLNRAAVLAGEEKVAMLAVQHPLAQVTVRWRSSMGVVFASEASVDLGVPTGGASGGSAAADLAVAAARRAVDAAVKDAVARSALKRISSELALTARRQRALERRWLPALTDAQKRLNGALDELEREEATRALWARRHKRRSRP
jgi:V/A-type H+-transporting ATPase subunit D